MVVIDGLTYNMTQSYQCHASPMVFLNSIKDKSIWCEKAYSHGPYTEAGIKSVLHGKFPLENGGYYTEHISWDDSMMKVCNDSGYDLFSSYFASFIPPECLIKGGYSYNTKKGNPMFSRYLTSKLDYYYSIWKKEGTIKDYDYDVIAYMLERFFESVEIIYSSKSTSNDYTGSLTPYICDDKSYNQRKEEGLKKLRAEYAKFSLNFKEYIDGLFKEYSSHPLLYDFNWAASPYCNAIKEQKKWLSNNFSTLFKRINNENRNKYLKNNLPTYKNVFNHVLKLMRPLTVKEGIEFFLRLYKSIFTLDFSKMLDEDLQQICTSAGSFVDQFCEWNKKRVSTAPYFAYLHFDEFHRPLSFITHESTDYERLRSELSVAEAYVGNLPKDYKGDIGFDLAAGYIDGCIKRLFSYLDDQGQLDNTIVIVTSDHGSSNCGETARFTCTNHFFKEQYHIPVMIYGCGKKHINSYVWGVDVPYTVFEMCGIKPPSDWVGASFLNTDRKYAVVEYTGGGVSDVIRRPIMFGYRDDNKSFVVKAIISQNPVADDFHVCEYYDLNNDPNEITNISSQLSDDEKALCKAFFINRAKHLYEDNKNYAEKLSNKVKSQIDRSEQYESCDI